MKKVPTTEHRISNWQKSRSFELGVGRWAFSVERFLF